jgi:hypothetical protein
VVGFSLQLLCENRMLSGISLFLRNREFNGEGQGKTDAEQGIDMGGTGKWRVGAAIPALNRWAGPGACFKTVIAGG